MRANHLPADSTNWLNSTLNKDSLRYLSIYLAVQSLVVAVFICAFYFYWGFELPQRLLVAFLPLQFFTALIAYRFSLTIKTVRTWHYLMWLVLSVGMLVWFLHDSGGHTNPLISLLLVPLAMSAAMLGWQASLVLAVLVLASYTGLMYQFVPLSEAGHDMHHHNHHQMMQLHLFGMWVAFCLSVLLIMMLVIPLAASVRKQREYIAQQREQALQDERLVAMATFAASAAHQLGTPLSTLSVIAEDLADEFKDNELVQQDIRVMTEQVAHCKETLHSLMRRADAIRNNEKEIISVEGLLKKIRGQFNLLNPAYSLQLAFGCADRLYIESDETLEQAILNLLDNAARASESNPVMEVEVKSKKVCLRILDTGPGISEAIQDHIGQPYISTREKNEGMGLGLFLSNSTISRLGGSLKLYPTASGNATEVWLPLVSAKEVVGD